MKRIVLFLATSGILGGGGMMLALSADRVVAIESSYFALPEIDLGSPTYAGMAMVSHLAGGGVSADIALTGRRMSARDAHAHGLVAELVPDAELQARAQAAALLFAGKAEAVTLETRATYRARAVTAIVMQPDTGEILAMASAPADGSVVPFFQRLIDEGAAALPITDERMTRFWILLEDGVAFAFSAFERMHGGEIFVPKIPSVRITDLATAMAPGLPQEVVGIRPGEKIHEVMCPMDDSHLTLEFADHFVIRPTITFQHGLNEFETNALGASGVPVGDGFEYESGANPHFLDVDEIRALNARIGYA